MTAFILIFGAVQVVFLVIIFLCDCRIDASVERMRQERRAAEKDMNNRFMSGNKRNEVNK